MRIGPYVIAEQPRRRADGGRHRSAVPAAVQAARRGLRGVGDGRVESAAVGHRQVAAAHRSRGRGRADRRADRRRRSGDDGRRRALQRRARRADHRHQHGLPGEEGVQRRRRLGAARRTSRWSRRSSTRSCARSTCRSRSRSAPVRIRRTQRVAHRAHRARTRASRRSPCTAARARARSSVAVEYDTIARREARGAHPGDRQRRHRHAGRRATVLAYTGADAIMIGRAAQGRPWIFREIAHFLATGDAPAAADGRGGARADSSSISPITTRSTARRRACASRASTSAGTRSDLAGGDAVPRANVNAAETTQAQTRGRAPLLRRARRNGDRLVYAPAVGDIVDAGARFDARRDNWRAMPWAGRPSPREKKHSPERQQRDRPQRRALARRVFPARSTASRRTGVYDMVIGHVERALLASIMDAHRTATRRRPPTCSA